MIGRNNASFTILHRYFWPQNLPYARMLKDIAETAVSGGYKVSVMSSKPQGNDALRGQSEWGEANKINLRLLGLGNETGQPFYIKVLLSVYYAFWVFWRLLCDRPDMVMVATTPPVIVAAVVRWVTTLYGGQYIYHCQDIHPEAMCLNENIGKGFIYRVLLWLDKKNVDEALHVIVLSEDMKKTLVCRGCKSDHIKIINNYIFECSPEDTNTGREDQKVRFLFAGGIGRFQNLEFLFDAIEVFSENNDVEFHFMGDGPMLDKLRGRARKSNLDNVIFLGRQPVQAALIAMQNADVGIVSLSPGIAHVAYPSKTMMYLGNGLPLLTLIDANTELFNFIEVNDLGRAVSLEHKDAVVEAIDDLIRKGRPSKQRRGEIKALAYEVFGKKSTLEKFSRVFNEC
jgi:glycosyltransferase involved in cell wall biosynthesis